MATNIKNLLNKKENQGLTKEGRLSVDEFKTLVTAVIENQDEAVTLHNDIDTLADKNKANVKSINYKGTVYVPNAEGNVILVEEEGNKSMLSVNIRPMNTSVVKGQDCIVTADVIYKEYKLDPETGVGSYEPAAFPATVKYFLGKSGEEKEIYSTECKNGGVVKYNLKKDIERYEEAALSFYILITNGIAKNETSRIKLDILEVSIFPKDLDETKIRTADSWVLQFNVTATKAPTIHIQIDNNQEQIEVLDPGVFVSGSTIIRDKEYNKGRSGARKLKIWAEINPDFGDPIISDPYEIEYIYANPEDLSTGYLIASNIYSQKSLPRYANLNLKYWMYNKGKNDKVTVSLYLSGEKNGEPIANLQTQQILNFKEGTSDVGYWILPLIGDKSLEGLKYLVIDVDGYKESHPITILPAELELNHDITYEVYLTSAGRKNSDLNKSVWECTNYKGDKTYRMEGLEKLDFLDSGSGWKTHEDGSTSLHLRKGNFITLNYKPFSQPITFKKGGTGLTLSFELAVSGSTNKDAIAISCMGPGYDPKNSADTASDVHPSGIEIKANEISFVGQGNIINCEYRENDRVKIDLVIEGKERAYKDGDTTYSESLVWLYIDGVYQRMYKIPNAATDYTDYRQVNPVGITFGSNDCELDLYTVRGYDHAITVRSILDNYSYDMPVPADRAIIKKRNEALVQINEEGDISVNKKLLQQARPELPIMYWDMAGMKLPLAKKPYLLMDLTTYDNPMKKMGKEDNPLEPKLEYSNATFTVGDPKEDSTIVPGGFLGCQGSSSMRYPAPYKNYDWRTSGDLDTKAKFDFGNGVLASKYSLYPNMPPISKITLKKDYASSEMVNNVICSELFSDMAEGLGGTYGSPTQEITNDYSKYRLSLKGIPIFVYYNDEYIDENEKHVEKEVPLGMFNMIPNKNEVDYLGFTTFQDKMDQTVITFHEGFDEQSLEPNGNQSQSWEIRDNFEFMEDTFEPAHWAKLPTLVSNDPPEGASDEEKKNYYSEANRNAYVEADIEKNDKASPFYGMESGEIEVYLDLLYPVVDERPESHYLAKERYENLWRVPSVFMSYEARTPKDSFLSYKLKEGKKKYEDFGFHSDKTYTDEDWNNLSALEKENMNKALQNSVAECEELRIFHNFVASCNPDKVSKDDDLENPPKSLKEMVDIANDPENPLSEKYKTYGIILNAKSSEKALGNDAYKDAYGHIYKNDSKEYRLAKFKTEGEYYWNGSKWVVGGHLRLNQWLLYYIWAEQFWMMDSLSKNLQVYTMGRHRTKVADPMDPSRFEYVEDMESPYEWGVMVRDADTGLGIDNQGKFAFPPYLEDVDYYSYAAKNENEKFDFHYPEKFTEIQPNEPKRNETFADVLNGQKGVMWQNLRRCYGGPKGRLAEVYRNAISNDTATNFSFEKTSRRFEKYQEAWAESLYDFGSIQYHGSTAKTAWITSGLGDKKHQRRNWLYYGFRYRQSKYHVNNEKSITTKILNPAGDVDLKVQTYTPIYIRTSPTDSTEIDMFNYQRHVDLTKKANLKIKKTAGAEVNGYIFDGDLYTDLGNLYEIGGASDGIRSFTAQFPNGKLKSLRFGNHADKVKYKNTALYEVSYESFPEIEYLDLTNCTVLGSAEKENGSLSVGSMRQLKELYLENTLYTAVGLPETPTLERIWMNPGSNSIYLKNLPNLSDYTIADHIYHKETDSYEIKETYRNGESTYGKVTNITILNCPKINTYNLIEKTINNGVLNYIEIDTVGPHNGWDNATVEVVDRLIDMKANIEGTINIPGKNKVDFNFKKKMIDAWGNIDDPENKIHVTYEERKVESLKVAEALYYKEPGDYHLTFTPEPNLGNDWTRWEWTLEPNDYATLDTDGTLHVTQIGEEIHEPKATATITLYKKNGSNISSQIPLFFYNRVAKPGYYVFKDGSFGPNLEGKKPIGICFWVDPMNDQNRLMFATMHLNMFSGLGWGPSAVSNSDLVIPGAPDLNLSLVPNLPIVNDFVGPGSSDTFKKAELTDDQYYRDFDSGDKDNFTRYDSGQFFAQLGFDRLKEPLEDYVIGDEQPEFKYNVGDKLPYGKHFTLRIISFRNKILKILGKELPKKTYDKTEYANLFDIINNEIKNGEFADGLIYFPAASACYSYSPLPTTGKDDEDGFISDLDDKFKEGNWFLPTAGELARIQYYLRKSTWSSESKAAGEGYNKEDKNNVFQKAIDEGILSINYGVFRNDSYFKTSSVAKNTINDSIAGIKTYENVVTSSVPKTSQYSYPILPICQF